MSNGVCYSKFFSNKECEYFPCHVGIPDEEFNCLFCFCPLYLLGEDCGGNFSYSKSGKKDCSHCTIPHKASNYDMICNKLNSLGEKN